MNMLKWRGRKFVWSLILGRGDDDLDKQQISLSPEGETEELRARTY